MPRERSRPSTCRRALATALAMVCLLASPGQAEQDPERELNEVRSRLEELRRARQRDVERRDDLSARLRNAELLLASLRRNVASIREERASSEARVAALARERRVRQQDLSTERGALARQLHTAYVNGREERIKLLLSQANPALIGRMLVYYGYLNASRVGRIDTVVAKLDSLQGIERDASAESERLRKIESQRAAELVALERASAERRDLVSSLDARIAERATRITQMEQREETLLALLEELRKVFADLPVEAERSLSELKGSLNWPAHGLKLASFGAPRAGSRIRWNGVLIGAERGSPVRAVAHGRVAYADWLPGMGLLVVVEHGDGYMSLYGHNESLRKSAGDWVGPGDEIATVGDSGGRTEPALYFELRRGRKPLDPDPWFGTSLARR